MSSLSVDHFESEVDKNDFMQKSVKINLFRGWSLLRSTSAAFKC